MSDDNTLQEQEYTPEEIAGLPTPMPTPEAQPEEYTAEQIAQGIPDIAANPTKQAEAAIYGGAKGVIGPVAPFIATHTGMATPQDLRNLEEAFPVTSELSEAGSFLGSALIGLPGIAKGASLAAHLIPEAAEGASLATQATRAALRTGMEFGLIQSANEASKKIEEQPGWTLGNAAAHVGLSSALGLVGGATFGAVSPLISNKLEEASKFLEDFRKTAKFDLNLEDPGKAVFDEISAKHDQIKKIVDEVEQSGGLREQATLGKVPDMNSAMKEHVDGIISDINGALKQASDEPGIYSDNAALSKLQGYRDRLVKNLNGADSKTMFSELNNFKKGIGKYANFSGGGNETEGLVGKAYDAVKKGLEDTGIWGEAGKNQAELNAAVSSNIKGLQDLRKRFGYKDAQGQWQINPVPVQTFVNAAGTMKAGARAATLGNSMKAMDNIISVAQKLDPSVSDALSAPITNEMMQELTPGGKAARAFAKNALGKLTGRGAGAAIGGAAGTMTGLPGGGWAGSILGAHILGPALENILPPIARTFMGKAANAEGLAGAAKLINAAMKGDSTISNGVKNLIKGSSELFTKDIEPSDIDLDKFDDGLKAAQADPSKLMNSGIAQGYYMPDHATHIAMTAANTVRILNSMRPNTSPSNPLEDDRKPSRIEEHKFRKALAIAEQPALALKRIKDGTLSDGEMAILSSIHPDVLQSMHNKIIEEMAHHAGRGEIIPYKTRIALSKFLGAPLSSTLNPVNILANQMIAPPGGVAQQGQAQATGKGTSKTGQQKSALQKLSGMYNTPVQAREKEKTNVS